MRRIIATVTLILLVCVAAGATRPKKENVLRMLENVKRDVEIARNRVARMYNTVLDDHLNGMSEADSLRWFNTVVPLAKDAMAHMDTSLCCIDDVLLQWKNYESYELGRDLSDLHFGIRPYRLKDVEPMYGDDYLLVLTGRQSMMDVYLTSFYWTHKELEEADAKVISLIEKLRDDPEYISRKYIKEQEKKLRDTEVEERPSFMLDTAACARVYREHSERIREGSVSTSLGVDLGMEYGNTRKKLRSAGFRFRCEDVQDHPFYGRCRHAFFSGKVDGYPVSLEITAPYVKKRGMVFAMEIIHMGMIDEREAEERLTLLAASDSLLNAPCVVEKHDPSSLGTSMVETVEKRGRTYKRLANETSIGCHLRVKATGSDDIGIGGCSLRALEDFSDGRYVIEEYFRDYRWEDYAEALYRESTQR